MFVINRWDAWNKASGGAGSGIYPSGPQGKQQHVISPTIVQPGMNNNQFGGYPYNNPSLNNYYNQNPNMYRNPSVPNYYNQYNQQNGYGNYNNNPYNQQRPFGKWITWY